MNINLKYFDLSLEDLSKKYQFKVTKLHNDLLKKVSLNDSSKMVDWYNFPNNYDKEIIKKMKVIKSEWKKLKITHVVVVGIGGSYSGIKALVDMFKPNLRNNEISLLFFNSLSTVNTENILNNIKNKNFALVCVSKSGTTLETAVGFRIFREILYKRYKKQHYKRVVAITDPDRGVLCSIAKKNNYFQLPINPGIGGRFSSITSVSLFPALLVGADIEQVLAGASAARSEMSTYDIKNNKSYLYAVLRYHMYKELKKEIEVVIGYEKNVESLLIQHRQLFGESEGKDNKGLFPIYSIFTTDLHSMGQFYQEGTKNFFETTLFFKNLSSKNIIIPKSSFNDDDNFSHLAGKSLFDINEIALLSTIKAHSRVGKVPNILIEIDSQDEYNFGYVYYFLCLATAMSAMLIGVNPFNQPGVEEYKKNMKELLSR